MEEVSAPVSGSSISDVPRLNEIKKEFPFSEPNSEELTRTNFKLKMEEDVKCEVSLEAIVDSTAGHLHVNEIKKEFYFDELTGTNFKLKMEEDIKSEVTSEAPEFGTNRGHDDTDIKLEPLESDELHIKDESDVSSTDQTEENSTEDQHFDCNHCSTQNDRREHLKSYTETRSFKCKLCDYASVRENSLRQHMQIHSDKKPFKCLVCDYRCRRKYSLQQHMRVHTGEKPFQCSVCEYACAQSSHLQQHIKIHSGEKPFKCSICGYRSVGRGRLQEHLKSHTVENSNSK